MNQQDLASLLKELVNSLFWEESQVLITSNPILLSDDAQKLLTYNLDQNRGDRERLRIIQARLSLLQRCRQHGVDAAFADYPAITEPLLGFINTQTWEEKKEIVERYQNQLLSDPAQELLSYLIQQNDDAETAAYLQDCWVVLEQCRQNGVETTFGELMRPTRGIVSADLLRRAMAAESKEQRADLQREHPELSPLFRHLDQVEAKLAELGLSRPEDLSRRVQVYREAIALINPTLLPLQWAACQLGLADDLVRSPAGDRVKNLEEAIQAYKQALTVYTRNQMPENWAQVHHKLGNAYIYRVQGNRADNLEQAIVCYQDALAVISSEAIPREWAMVQTNVGEACRLRIRGERADNLEQAISHFQEALKVWTGESFDKEELAQIHLNLSAAYLDRVYGLQSDNHMAAIAQCEQALGLVDPQTAPDLWGKVQLNLGNLHRVSLDITELPNRLDRALEHYQQALQVLTREQSPMEWAMGQTGLGHVYSDQPNRPAGENLEVAIGHYNHALEVLTRDRYPYEWAMTQHNLGLIYADRVQGAPADNLNMAVAHLRQALQIYTSEAFPADRRQTLRALGDMYFAHRDWEKALEAYDEVIELGETFLAGAYTVVGREAETTETSRLYPRAAYCMLQLEQPSKALIRLEQGKARLLNQALSVGEVSLEGLPVEQRNGFLDRQRVVRELETELRLSPDTPSRRGDAELGQLLHQSRGDLKHLIEAIRAEHPAFLPVGLDLPDILALVPVGGALLFPLVTAHGSAVWVLPHGQKDVGVEHLLWLDAFDERALTALLTAGAQGNGWLGSYFASQSGGEPTDWQATVDAVTAQLWDVLMGPVYERLAMLGLAEGATVALLPQRMLGLLPLHAAWREIDGNRRSFLDDFTVSYVPSAYSLAVSHRRVAEARRHFRSLFSVTDPTGDLPFAVFEAHGIGDFFAPMAQQTLHGDQATRDAVANAAPDQAYLHFACHGVYEWHDATRSGLVFADGELLTLGQIASSDMDLGATRLVVLSACETGLSEVFRMLSGNVGVLSGEEYVGLPAGFLQVGAPGVVGSLWPVNDLSTALLMIKFYEYHLQGDAKTAEGALLPTNALRQAQLWLRDVTNDEVANLFDNYRKSDLGPALQEVAEEQFRNYAMDDPELRPFANPDYWAPFVFYGA